MIITRREFCGGSAALIVAVGLQMPAGIERAFAQTVAAAELMVPGPLGEMALGPANAPVTVIEYASMTCSHCASFAINTLPKFKTDYIDTGKVRYILREFPLDPLAAAGFMLARCAANGDANKYFAMVDTLFHQQGTWVVQKPLPPLLAIGKQAGLNEKAVEDCLANQTMVEGIEAVRKRGVEKLGVSSTPTFFVNGQKAPGALSYDELVRLVTPYLKAG